MSDECDQYLEDCIPHLEQGGIIQEGLVHGDGPWTVIFERTCDNKGGHCAKFAVLAQPEKRDEILANMHWDFHYADGKPGLWNTSVRNQGAVEYGRDPNKSGFEPLLVRQEFHSVVPDVNLISEEFRLLMDLWENPQDRNYYQIKNDGSRELAIRMSETKIEVHTPILRKYQAARQLDLVLFVESFSQAEGIVSCEIPENLFIEWTGHHCDNFVSMSRTFGDIPSHEKTVASWVTIKRILPAPPIEKCGIGPFAPKAPQEYAEFIIGEDQFGGVLRHSCNPDLLFDDCGTKPRAVQYCTPVFFKTSVLQKYYDDSDLYRVQDGYLACAEKWGVEIDNCNPDFVAVLLGDIGKSIPESQWAHWQSHNIPPMQKVNDIFFRRHFLNQYVESENPEHRFEYEYRKLQKIWKDSFGWTLYREPKGPDAKRLDRLRIPVDDTDAEFTAQLLNLAVILVDLLNEKELSKNLEPVKDEKGIAKLKRFLTENNYSQVEETSALLKKIQKLRSKWAAHSIGNDAKNHLEEELKTVTKAEFVSGLITEATDMLSNLTLFAEFVGSVNDDAEQD